MAVIDVVRIFEGEQLSQDRKHTEYTRVYRVETDDPTDNAFVVGDASANGETVPPTNGIELATGLRVTDKKVVRDGENPTFHTITVTLSNAADDKQTSGNGKQKLNVDIKVNGITYEEPVYLDKDKNPVANTVGEPFANQPTRTYYDHRITVSFDTQVVDQDNIDLCLGYPNAAPVTVNVRGYRRSFATGTLKLADYSVTNRISEGVYFWHVEYVFDYRKDGWKKKILNTGFKAKHTGQPGRLFKICFGTSTTPVETPISKNGWAIIDSSVGVCKAESDPSIVGGTSETNPGDRCYREFELVANASYAGLLVGIR
jgi:hypothetical protein